MLPQDIIDISPIIDVGEADSLNYEENLGKDRLQIKKSMKIEQDTLGTYVYVVAIHRNPDLNDEIEISAEHGDPISKEVHDFVRNWYYIEGVSVHEIGLIPVNYRIVMEDARWEEDIPLPLPLIRRYMTKEQTESFEAWKLQYKGDSYRFRYLQILRMY